MDNNDELREVYLDNASTTKVSDEAMKIVANDLKSKWYNPSGLYSYSNQSKKLLENIRETTKFLLNADKKDKIVFTSSGCEANSLAIDPDYIILHDPLSHSSIIDKCKWLKSHDLTNNIVESIGVSRCGKIDLVDLYSKIIYYMVNTMDKKGIIISICAGNNEIGTIQDLIAIRKTIESAKRHAEYSTSEKFDVYLHVDAVQLYADRGNYWLDVKGNNIDMMTLSGHKIGCPAGVGLLYIKDGVDISPIIFGEQEYGLRGGTENLAYIHAFLNAMTDQNKSSEEINNLVKIRDYFIKLLKHTDKFELVGHATDRLSNNVSGFFKNVDGQSLLLYLDSYGIQCSTGSACNSFNRSQSHVLRELGYPESEYGFIRFTLNQNTSIEDIDYVYGIIQQYYKSLEVKETEENVL